MATELLIILVLLLANGVFALTELAIVSARRTRLKKLAEGGDDGARAALELAESPTRFLATIQFSITLIGVCAGAYAGDTLADELTPYAARVPGLADHAHAAALAIVVAAITIFSLVLGELLPKRIAVRHPEVIALLTARPMRFLSHLFAPVVNVFGGATDLVLRLIGLGGPSEPTVSDEEVKDLMQEGLEAGVFDATESEMVESVLELDSLAVKEIMTPRPKIVFLGRDEPPEQVWHKIVVSGHSTFPVYEGNRDNLVGIISVKSLFANLAAGLSAHLRDLMVKPVVVPETQTVRHLLEIFKKSRFHLALVADEFGSIAGLVTMSDVAQAVLGDFPSQHERLMPEAKQRDDGSWLIDGLYNVDDLGKHLQGIDFPQEPGREYQTLAGFVVTHLSHVPTEGESFDWDGWRFEIIDMDRHRVDKMLVSRPAAPAAPVALSSELR